MKTVILAVLVAVAAGFPTDTQTPIPIVRQSQVNPELGAHNFEFESANGISVQESGSEGSQGGANRIGEYSYIQEDGTVAKVTFVADENGFQPQSDLLPVAPTFPHPIPEYVLVQIAFAEEERKRLEREGKSPL
ncbi:hypothetical protein OTU49_009056 [Cherax quadricarinatus]|uniref:Uncharacterized protein n=1 Tax=Cherax quadricarinatus TaxID=27406 RepID=A0AAW0WB33_CHEQU|nr:cuticle protein AMP4-like [Cherax quadricarinatus]